MVGRRLFQSMGDVSHRASTLNWLHSLFFELNSLDQLWIYFWTTHKGKHSSAVACSSLINYATNRLRNGAGRVSPCVCVLVGIKDVQNVREGLKSRNCVKKRGVCVRERADGVSACLCT